VEARVPTSDVQVREAPEPRGPAAYGAEVVGTFLLVFGVCGVISVGSNQAVPLDLAGLGLFHALVLMVLVYALGGTSGAHFNPAVTIALLSIRKISPASAAVYIACQVVGGLLGALLAALLFNEIGEAVNYGAATVNPDVLENGSVGLALIAEGVGTFILMWAIMATAVNPRGNRNWAPLVIGATLGLCVMVMGPLTGAGFNPARAFGPALVAGNFDGGFFDFVIPFVIAPLLGAVLAAAAYFYLFILPGKKGPTPLEPVG
jgi:MIP family channel proteins